jgi:hypothetical protein
MENDHHFQLHTDFIEVLAAWRIKFFFKTSLQGVIDMKVVKELHVLRITVHM